jgi:hypothetical protein
MTGPVGKFDFGAGAGVAVVGGGIGGTYYLSGSLRYFVMENVAVEGEIGYWSKTYTLTATDPFTRATLEAKTSDLAIGMNAYYVQPIQPAINGFVGGGVGIHFQKASGEASASATIPGFGTVGGKAGASVTTTDFSLRFIGGIEYSVSKNAKAFGIVRYDISGPSVFKVYGGFRFGP